jgi:lipase chaperone LimK
MSTLPGLSRTRLLLGSALVALAVTAILWPRDGDKAPSRTGLSEQATRPTSGAAPATAAAPSALHTNPFDQAARLLELGVAGDMRVDENTRGALDVLLASLSTPPTAAELDELEAALRRAMPGEAATQSIALVRRYADYTQAAAADSAAQQPPTTLAELNALLDKTIALRRKHFDAETAQSLFGSEEAQTRHVLALQAIEADTQLSAADKAARVKALRAQMPPEAAAHEPSVSLAMGEMEDKIAALRRQGASAAQIEQARQGYIGTEAAQAMGEMELQRERWESRYQAFLQEKRALGASGATDTAQVEALLRQHYSDEELTAAKAYDRAQHP